MNCATSLRSCGNLGVVRICHQYTNRIAISVRMDPPGRIDCIVNIARIATSFGPFNISRIDDVNIMDSRSVQFASQG